MITWPEHVARWRDCTACPLCQQRSNIVLARGQVPCSVLFCGEAPGESEDATGKPFWGPAGGLLDKILSSVIDGYNPITNTGSPSWAMTNLVACFPREAKARGDNEPAHSEILSCRPRLEEFIVLAQPKLIVCVGALASQYARIPAGVKRVDIVHPAFILARLPLAQKNMAVQKAIVVLRNAVEDML